MCPGVPGSGFDPATIRRPARQLLTYYLLVSALATIAFPFVFLPLYFKYHTLRYRLDDDGISMSWGLLFRREIHLTYRRMQDIHVTRNLFHRWLGLASVAIQTASGSAGAEMTIEGVLRPDELRDFLYARMRGARGERVTPTSANAPAPANDPAPASDPAGAAVPGAVAAPLAADGDEALRLLREIRDELRRIGGEGGRE